MSKPKFTKGPWWWVDVGIDGYLLCANQENYTRFQQFVLSFVDSVELADRHLIAAAPDLYAALAKAVADYGKHGGPWNVPSEPGTWIQMAEDALKKADGE